MNYWIIKSEPDVYSYDDLVKQKKGCWDGVRSFQARNNLKAMSVGDLALFYHSNIGKEVVGIAKIVKEAYQDPTTEDPNWVAVDVAPERKLTRPVSLHELKADPAMQHIGLIRLSRLSVIPLEEADFEYILQKSEQ